MNSEASSANAAQETANATEASATSCSSKDGVANLPFASGKVFYTLDEYLAHLERQGAIDLPYWHEIKPGVYERVVRMPGAEREIATRDELMKRFGFNC